MDIVTKITIREIEVDLLGGALPLYDNITGHSVTYDGEVGSAVYQSGCRSLAIVNENIPYVKQIEECEKLLINLGLEPFRYLRVDPHLGGCGGVLVWGKTPGE